MPFVEQLPPIDPNIAAWFKDPDFLKAPEEKKSMIIRSYFESQNASDEEFNSLDEAKREAIAQNFTKYHIDNLYEPYSEKQQASGFTGALTTGAKQTASGLLTAANVYSGDDQEVQRLSEEAQLLPQTPEQTAFNQVIEAGKQEGDETVWQGIKNVARAAKEQPIGALHTVAAQIPNMAATYGPMFAGAKVGLVLSGGNPLGAIAGGLVGRFIGTVGLETGFVAQEQARSESGYDREKTIKQGGIKGGVIFGVDTLTMGAGSLMFKSARGALQNTLLKFGIDPLDDAAVRAAWQNPAIKAALLKAGADAAGKVAPRSIQKAMAATGAGTLEFLGEGTGEYAGSKAAGLDASITEAVMESMMSVPQSVGDVLVSSTVSKIGDGAKKVFADTPTKSEPSQSVVKAPEKVLSQFEQDLYSGELSVDMARRISPNIQKEFGIKQEDIDGIISGYEKSLTPETFEGKVAQAQEVVQQETKPTLFAPQTPEEQGAIAKDIEIQRDMQRRGVTPMEKLLQRTREKNQLDIDTQEQERLKAEEIKGRSFEDLRTGLRSRMGKSEARPTILDKIRLAQQKGKGVEQVVPEQAESPQVAVEARTEVTPTPTMPGKEAGEVEGKKIPGKNPWEMSFDEFLETHNPPGETFSYKKQLDRLDKMDKGERFTPGKLSSEDLKNKIIAQAKTHHGKGFVKYALATGELTTEQAEKLGHFEAYPDLKKAPAEQGQTTNVAPATPEVDEGEIEWRSQEKKAAQIEEADEWIKAYTPIKKWTLKDSDKAWDEHVLQTRTPDVTKEEFLQIFKNRLVETEPTLAKSATVDFDSTISDLKKESPGRRIFNIHQVREKLGNPKDFDTFLETARKDRTIQLHGGDPSIMTPEQIKNSYKDAKGDLWIGVSSLKPVVKESLPTEKPLTKKEKSLKEYTDLVSSLTDDQKNQVKGLISEGEPELPGVQVRKIREALKEKPTAVESEVVEVETDQAKRQEIKNSIAEGEMLLKGGKKTSGQKFAKEELGAIQRSVDKAKKKLGDETPVEIEVTGKKEKKPSGLPVDASYFNTDPKKFDGYAWRIMSEDEYKKLEAGEKTYGGGVPGKGNYLAPTPESTQQYAKDGKVLVEFSGVEKAEGETVTNQIGKDNITKVMRYDGKSWADYKAETPHVKGKKGTAFTPKNQKIDFEYAVADMKDIIKSHDTALHTNPAYPKEIQPRQRDRKAMIAQVETMARQITPERLGEAPGVGSGAPIVGPDFVVESGNGRAIALEKAYTSGNAKDYKQWILDNAESFGIDKNEAEEIKNPVLVRVRKTEVDRVAFAKEANQDEVARMSPYEQAVSDAERITNEHLEIFRPSEDGSIVAAANRPFVDNFLAMLGTNESAGLLTAEGKLTKQGADRIQAAIFAKAYQDEALLTLQSEEVSPDIKNIINALTVASSEFAIARGLRGYESLNVIEHLVSAAKIIRTSRNQGVSVQHILDQKKLFETYTKEAEILAKYIDVNIRSAKRLGLVLKGIATSIKNDLLGRNQLGMFGKEKLTPQKAIEEGVKRGQTEESKQGSLFGESVKGANRKSEPGEQRGTKAKDAEVSASTETEKVKPKPDAKEEGKAEGKDELTLIEASPNDLPFETAMRAHSGTSFDPERRAKYEQDSYYKHIKEVHDDVLKTIKPEQQEQAKEEISQYKDTYLSKLKEILHGRSGIYSSMISGPSNFPTSRMQKKNDADQKRTEAFYEWQEKAVKGMKKRLGLIGGTAISSDDVTAIDQLKAKIEKAEAKHEKMLGINKIIKNKSLDDTEKIKQVQEQFGFKEETAKKLLDSTMVGGKGFATFELTNNRANIKRMRERVLQLEKQQADITTEIEVDNITIKDNVEDNRVQIFYPGKPDEDTRKQLKSRGFKWSPSVGAWQRMRSRDAMHYAKDIVGYKEPDAKFARKFKPVDIESKDRIDEIVQKFKDHSGYDRWADDTGDYPSDVIGIRAVHDDVEIGDVLPASYELTMEDWDQMTPDELEPYKLGGTSSFLIPVNDFLKDPSQAIRTATEKATKYGNKLVFIHGTNWGTVDSSDKGEVLIKDAEVIDVFEPEDIGVEANWLLPRFSYKTEESWTIANASELQQSIDSIMSKFKGIDKGRVEVYQSEKDLPKALQDQIKEKKAEGQFYAVTYDGKIYFAADNLRKGDVVELAVIEGLMRHEGRHWAIDQIMNDKERSRFFGAAALKYKKEVAKYLRDNKLEVTNKNRALAAEEIIVEKIKAGETNKFIDRFLAKVAEWLRAVFPGIKITTAEVRDLISRADQIIEGKEVVGLGSSDLARFQLGYHGGGKLEGGKFDLGKVGKSEGTTNEGYGIYFSEDPDATKYYQEAYGGYKYTVDIPDNQVKSFLRWNDSISEQPNKVKQRILNNDEIKSVIGNSDIESMTGKELYSKIAEKTSQEQASKIFKESGIPGNIYKTGAYLKNGKLTKDTNYVVWDQALLDQISETMVTDSKRTPSKQVDSTLKHAKLEYQRALSQRATAPLWKKPLLKSMAAVEQEILEKTGWKRSKDGKWKQQGNKEARFTRKTEIGGKGKNLFKTEPLTPEQEKYLSKLRTLYTSKDAISPKKTLKLIERYETLNQELKDAREDIYKKQAALEKHIKDNLPPAEQYRMMHHIKKMVAARTETRQKRFDEAMVKLEEAHERVIKQSAINKIEKILKDKKATKTNRGVLSNKGMESEANRMVGVIQNAISMNQNDALESILELYEQLDAQNREPTTAEIEKINLTQMFSDLKNKDLGQINAALETLKTIVADGKLKWKLAEEKRKEDAKGKQDQFFEEITGGEGIPKQEVIDAENKGVLTTVLKGLSAYDTYHQSWEMLLDKLARKDKESGPLSSKTTEYFAGVVHAVTHKENTGVAEQQNLFYNKLAEIYGPKRLAKKLRKNGEVKKKTGVFRYYEDGPIEKPLSQNTAYKLWQMFQQPSIQEEMRLHGYTEQTKAQLEKFIDPKVMRWAKWQVEEFFPQYRNGINDIYKALFYIDMPNVEGYSPISRVYEGKKQDDPMLGENGHYTSVIAGSVKSRVKNSRDFNIMDGDSVLLKHVTEMEHFKAWGVPMRELRSVMGSERIQRAIKHHHGVATNGALKSFIDQFASGGIDRANTLNALDKIRANFTRSVLGINPVVFLKQLTSIPAYLFDIPTKDWTTGMASFFANPFKAYKTLMESEMMQSRYKRGWERDIVLALKRSSSGVMSKTKSMTDRLMFMTSLGDKGAILIGGWTAYRYHLNKLKKQGLSQAEAHKKALIKFERSTERHQQAGQTKDLAYFQRLGSIGKLFTMFMTAPTSYYRNMSMGMRNLAAGRGSKIENLRRMAVAQFILPMFFQWIASGFDWDEDKQLRAAIIGPFNGLFILRDGIEAFMTAVTEGRMYYTVGVTPPLSTMQKAAYAGIDINKIITDSGDGDEFFTAAEKIIEVAGLLTGVPVGTIQRTLEGVEAVQEGKTERPIRRIIGFPEPKEKQTD